MILPRREFELDTKWHPGSAVLAATAQADGSYILSELLRGRRGTEWARSTHLVGDRFVLTPGGQLIEDECPKGMCLSALAETSKVMPAISERLIGQSDPQFERVNIVQCPDVGLDKGGWGKILMKVYVEKSR